MHPIFVSKIAPVYFPKIQSRYINGITAEYVESDCETTLSDFIQTWGHLDKIKFQLRFLQVFPIINVYVLDQTGTETLISPTFGSASIFYRNYEIGLSGYKNQKIQIVIKYDYSGTVQEVDRTPWMRVIDQSDPCMRNLRMFEYYGSPGLGEIQGVDYGAISNINPDFKHNLRIHCVLMEDTSEVTVDQYLNVNNSWRNAKSDVSDIIEVRFSYLPLWMIRKIGYIALAPTLKIDGWEAAYKSSPRRGKQLANSWLYEAQMSLQSVDAATYSY